MLALFPWCLLVWVVLTWTLTLEQIGFGVLVAALVTVALAPRRRVAGPWLLFRPRNLAVVARLAGVVAVRIVAANLRLAAMVWRPHIPLRSGMVVVPTRMRSSGGLTVVGLLSSLIVTNQIVDTDRARHRLQYHAVEVPDGTRAAYDEINGPIERVLAGWDRSV